MHENGDKEDDTMFMTWETPDIIPDEVWYIDSACSNHMTGNKSLFVELDEAVKSEVRTGDEKRHTVQGNGIVRVKTNKGTRRITNVYFILALKHNLLRVGQLLLNDL